MALIKIEVELHRHWTEISGKYFLVSSLWKSVNTFGKVGHSFLEEILWCSYGWIGVYRDKCNTHQNCTKKRFASKGQNFRFCNLSC